MINIAPRRRAAVSIIGAALFGLMAIPAGADPIVVPIRITSGTVQVERNPEQPRADARLVGSGGFVLLGGGVSRVPGGCDPCPGGDPAGVPDVAFLHGGTVS